MSEISSMSLLLPEGILDFFDLVKIEKLEKSYSIFLEEKNVTPFEFSSDKLLSKGFFDEITVQDFPIRNKATFLHIKRRKWVNPKSGDIVYRNWNMVAKGTRVTQEFAVFLKGIARLQAGER